MFRRPSRQRARSLLLGLGIGLLSIGATLLVQPYLFQDRADVNGQTNLITDAHSLTSELLKGLSFVGLGRTTQDTNRLKAVAGARAIQLVALMSRNPEKARGLMLPDSLIEKVGAAIGDQYVEKRVIAMGTVDFRVHDNQYKMTRTVTVQDSQSQIMYTVHFAGMAPMALMNGAQVKIDGYAIGDQLLTMSDDIQVVTPDVAMSESRADPRARSLAYVAPGDRKILAILANFTNNTSQPYTQGQISSLLFSGSNSVNGYYSDVSYGATTFSGDVTPWLTLPDATGDCGSGESTWYSHARTLATAQGYNLSNYNHVMIVLPPVCSWIGTATMPGSSSWIYANSLSVAAHEIGHNLGMDHAGSYSCGSKAIDVGANCSFSEYGNPYDTMGNIAAYHLDAPHEIGTGYIPLNSVQTITANGTYTVAPLEANSGIRALKIHKTDTNTDYYFEYRQALNRDASLASTVTRGVLVNMWSPGPLGAFPTYSATGFTYLLDGTPGSGGGFNDAALSDGGTFTDTGNGIVVSQVSHNSSGATVAVSFGGAVCTPVAPTIDISPTTQTAAPGYSVNYNLSITNNDSSSDCGSANFSYATSVPSGWTASTVPTSAAIPPGTTAHGVLTVASAGNASDAVYSVGIGTSETGVGAHSASGSTSYVVYQDAEPPPTVSTPTPTPSPPEPTPIVENPDPTPFHPTPTPKGSKKPKSTPTPTPAPTAEPTPEPSPSVVPTVVSTPVVSPVPSLILSTPEPSGSLVWLWYHLSTLQKIGLAVVLLGLLAAAGVLLL